MSQSQTETGNETEIAHETELENATSEPSRSQCLSPGFRLQDLLFPHQNSVLEDRAHSRALHQRIVREVRLDGRHTVADVF